MMTPLFDLATSFLALLWQQWQKGCRVNYCLTKGVQGDFWWVIFANLLRPLRWGIAHKQTWKPQNIIHKHICLSIYLFVGWDSQDKQRKKKKIHNNYDKVETLTTLGRGPPAKMRCSYQSLGMCIPQQSVPHSPSETPPLCQLQG